jgi:hypothetical protein
MAEPAANVKEATTESEWETVAPESGTPIRFEVGDVFTGHFQGIKHIVPPNAKTEKEIEDQSFDQALFTDENGQTRTINLGYKLREALDGVENGKRVRITRMEDVPMNDPGKNDLKDYRVEVAK